MDPKDIEFHFNDKLSFIARWTEGENQRNFILNFFPYDGTLCLVDMHKYEAFLKRTKPLKIELKDVYPCNTLVICGRPMQILDYANCYTKKIIGVTQEQVLLIIKPFIKYDKYPVLIAHLEKHFRFNNMRMAKLSTDHGIKLYSFAQEVVFTPALIKQITSGPCLIVELVGLDSCNRLEDILGPVDPKVARVEAPNSFRAIYGVDRITNAFHGTTNTNMSHKEIDLLLRSTPDYPIPPVTAQFQNNTLCIIKPHAVRKKMIGEIMGFITDQDFTITMMQIFYLNETSMDEFLEIYKGVVSEYDKLLKSFLYGPAVVLELGHKNSDINVHLEFRKLCGPCDPDIARQVRPGTLRGLFGKNKYENAVHCTDLPEDVIDDLEYFFKILQ